MATARAIANGNWSATGTWNGGVLPGNGDTVYANGFTVTIDQNITIGDANNPSVNAGSFVAGQYYQILSVGTTSFTGIGASANTIGVIFLATGAGSGTGTAKALATLTTLTNTAAGATTGGGGFTMSTAYNVTTDIVPGATTVLTIAANSGTISITNNRITGASVTSTPAVLSSGSGATINVNCVALTPTNGTANCVSISNTGAYTYNITGALAAGGLSSAFVNTSNSATINFTNCTIAGGGNANAWAADNTATGTFTFTNCTISGGTIASSYAIRNNVAGTLSGTGCIFTASTGPCVNNVSTGTLNFTNSTFTASGGGNAIVSTNASADVRLSGSFYDSANGYKAVYSPKWRLAVTPTAARTRYALDGTSTYVEMFTADNTGIAPAVGDVRYGVVYGSATGTCRVPAASSVAAGVLVDVASTGTAVLDPSAVASAVWSHATRTITGGTVDTLVNAPSVPTPSQIASQVRTELGTELGRIDQAISTRATPANIPTADITAIKAKTDALNTTRLAQTATTEIVGNLLAQANS